MGVESDRTGLPPKRIPLKHVVAVVMGNGLEFYDFLCYAIYAVYIGKAFFPAGNETASLLLSLATFGIGFVTRPVGGMVLGILGDRIGRKPAMLVSFALMGIGMLGLALTPSYAAIGFAAPLLVILFRLIQGFALGGEVGPSTAYLLEASPSRSRGFYASMQLASQRVATLIAALVGMLLAFALGDKAVADWAWRLPFLLGVLIVPFGLYIRHSLPETLHAADDAALAPDGMAGRLWHERLAPHLPVLIGGFLLLITATVGNYVISYGTTYAMRTLHLPAAASFTVLIVSSLAGIIAPLWSGAHSDAFGRKPILVALSVVMLLAVVPGFWVMTHFPAVWVVCSISGLLSGLSSGAAGLVVVILTEALPRRIRSGAVATVYALAISVFGGTTQFVITWAMDASGSALAPGWYWAAAALVGVLALPLMPETAPVKIEPEKNAAGGEPGGV